MNFLAHYFVDRITGKPYHNFGLILPDLMSMYKRKWKITEKVLQYSLHQHEVQIVAGVIKHNKLDSFFHQSDFFNKYTSEIKKILLGNGIEYPENRIFFLAHLLLELMIDRVIIRREKMILKEFYNELDEIDHNELEKFFIKINLPPTKGFYGYFIKFRKRKYLYKYANNFRLLYITNRILKRVGLPELVDQKRRMKRSFSQIDALLDNSYYEIISLRAQMILDNYSRVG